MVQIDTEAAIERGEDKGRRQCDQNGEQNQPPALRMAVGEVANESDNAKARASESPNASAHLDAIKSRPGNG